MEMEDQQQHHVDPDSGGGGATTTTAARRCAACKYLRRRCAPDCVLAPHFPASQPRRYADVHAVFGTSNVTRVLQSLPVQERARAADAMATEAHWRVQDPVYGCTGVIHRLQQEIRDVERQLATTRAQLAMHVVHAGGTSAAAAAAAPLLPHPPHPAPPQPPLLAADPAAATAVAVTTSRGGGAGLVGVVSVREDDEEEEAPLMDPDEFLDLDGGRL